MVIEGRWESAGMPFVVSPRFLCREGTSLFPSTYVPPRGSSTLDFTGVGVVGLQR